MFYPVPGKDDIFGENLSTSSTFARERSSIGKSSYCVRALSYCDLHKVMFADLQEILDMYPEFAGDFLAKFRVTFDLREVNRHCITKSENVLKQGAKDLIQSNRYGGSLNIHAQYTHTSICVARQKITLYTFPIRDITAKCLCIFYLHWFPFTLKKIFGYFG